VVNINIAYICVSDHSLASFNHQQAGDVFTCSMLKYLMNKTIMDRREEILAIARNYGAISVRIFGSLARGDDNPEDDFRAVGETELLGINNRICL